MLIRAGRKESQTKNSLPLRHRAVTQVRAVWMRPRVEQAKVGLTIR